MKKKSKISKAVKLIFRTLKLLLNDPKSLIGNLSKYTIAVDRKRYYQSKYRILPFVDITEIKSIDEEVENYTFLKGTSQPIDIAFLTAICKNYENCNYLEIGSWRGESIVNVARIAKKCTSISLSKEEILSMGMSQRVADTQRFFSKDIKNIKHIEANSLKYDFSSLSDKFDVIFVDGDHSYEGVKRDTENVFGLLRDDKSVIIWHDCGGGYEGYNYEVIAGIMDGAPKEKRDKIYRVSNTYCGIYTNQKLTPLNLKSPQIPNKVFSLKINMEPYDRSS